MNRSRPQVHVTEPEEIFSISEVAAVSLDDSQLVTLKLDSGNYPRFQPDTGAQYNVIPVNLYKKAAKDHKLAHVQPINSAIVAYMGAQNCPSSAKSASASGAATTNACLTASSSKAQP